MLRNCSPYNPNKGSTININSNALSTLDESLDDDQTLISRPSCSSQSIDWNVNENASRTSYSLNGLSKQSPDSPDHSTGSENSSKSVKRLLVKDLIWIGSQIASGMLFLQQNNCKPLFGVFASASFQVWNGFSQATKSISWILLGLSDFQTNFQSDLQSELISLHLNQAPIVIWQLATVCWTNISALRSVTSVRWKF